jgi:penicillin-binding protein 1A
LSIYFLVITTLLTLFIGIILYIAVILNIPDISSLEDYQPLQASLILDDHGQVVDRVFIENRRVITLDKMPELLPKAFIAAEDSRFYQHPGVDVWSILRALIHNVRQGRRGQGGSTITQQVARSLLLSPEKTYIRKLKEAILAYRIDRLLAKEEIIAIYLNQIYLGESAYGVEAAADIYFDKKARDLTLAEIAVLAGLPQAPSRYSPFKHFKQAKKRQAYVLNRMAAEGFITPAAARKAYNRHLVWGGSDEEFFAAEYYIQQVRNQVAGKYGRDKLFAGGLTIHTALNRNLQREADLAVQKGIAQWAWRQSSRSRKLPQAALVALEVKSGLVRALTGGANFSRSQFNRATQARRQPGSAFKPLVYAAGFAQGYSSATVFEDEPISLKRTDSRQWQPQNFSGRFYGPTTLYTGLVHSRNIVTIKLLQEIGVKPVIELAEKMGIKSQLRSDLSLALGSSEVSLLELTSAYAVFADNGTWHHPVFITAIEDSDGSLLEKNDSVPVAALDPRTSYQITYLLQRVISEGTGKKAWGLHSASAGKTGTTDRNRDAWFIGYTPRLATGVWMGFDKKATLGHHETGGLACAPVWLNFMRQAEKKYPAGDFAVPNGISFLPINPESGKYESGNHDKTTWLPFSSDHLPLSGGKPIKDKRSEAQHL